VESLGIARAEDLVARADVLLWLGEPSDAPVHPRLLRVHSKADLPGRAVVPANTLAVSSLTGEGIAELVAAIESEARALLPAEDMIALNRRHAAHLEEAAGAIAAAAVASKDLVVVAENLRIARSAFDRLTGRAGVEDLLDALFARFCLGK
jgi:tRNA modification GTPase